jgi:hypothetical protein
MCDEIDSCTYPKRRTQLYLASYTLEERIRCDESPITSSIHSGEN